MVAQILADALKLVDRRDAQRSEPLALADTREFQQLRRINRAARDDDLAIGAHLGEVAAALEKALGEAESVKFIWKPQNSIEVDADKGETLMKLIGILEDDDDVQAVFTNLA